MKLLTWHPLICLPIERRVRPIHLDALVLTWVTLGFVCDGWRFRFMVREWPIVRVLETGIERVQRLGHY